MEVVGSGGLDIGVKAPVIVQVKVSCDCLEDDEKGRRRHEWETRFKRLAT